MPATDGGAKELHGGEAFEKNGRIDHLLSRGAGKLQDEKKMMKPTKVIHFTLNNSLSPKVVVSPYFCFIQISYRLSTIY